MLFGMQELGMKNSFFCDLIINLNILSVSYTHLTLPTT